MYRRLALLPQPSYRDYETFSVKLITSILGDKLAPGILDENRNDDAELVTTGMSQINWNAICKVISQLPGRNQLEELYEKLAVKSTLDEIGVSRGLEDVRLKYSPMVRNILPPMRMRKCFELP